MTLVTNLVGAGIGAILPVVMEAMRDKPDPEVAKSLLRSQRQSRIEESIGAGMSMQQAEKQVDAQLQQEFAAADEAGEFNTPWGEMVAGALLGGAAPWAVGKISGMVKGAGKVAANSADDAAAAAAKSGGPSPADVQSAMSAGMPLTKGKAVVTSGSADTTSMIAGNPRPAAEMADLPLSRGKAVVTGGGGDVESMLGGGPFPSRAGQADIPLSYGKSVVTKGGGSVDDMLAGGPFPSRAGDANLPLSYGKSVVTRGGGNVDDMLGAVRPTQPTADIPLSSGKAVVTRGGGDVEAMLAGGRAESSPFPMASQSGSSVVGRGNPDIMGMMGGKSNVDVPFASQSGSSVVGRGAVDVGGMLGKDAIASAIKSGSPVVNNRLGRRFKIDAIKDGRVNMSGPDGEWSMSVQNLIDDMAAGGEWALG